MNQNVIKASFSIQGYKVSSFSYKEATDDTEKLSIKFDPKGIYNESTGVFKMLLGFQATEEVSSINVVEVNIEAYFKFNEELKLNDIPPYFYKNSIAIIFPYLRSFISTLTVQANVGMIILPLLNLGSLEKPFKDNTSVISKEI